MIRKICASENSDLAGWNFAIRFASSLTSSPPSQMLRRWIGLYGIYSEKPIGRLNH